MMKRFFASALAALFFVSQAAAQGLPFPGPGMPAKPVIGTPASLGSGQSSSSTTVTMTTSADIPAGSLVVVGVSFNKGSSIAVSSVSDGTNSYTLARTSTWNAGPGRVLELWYKQNASAVSSGATITATANTSSSSNLNMICAAYVTGVQTSSSLDAVNSTVYSPGTAYASGSTGTLAQANEIAFGLAGGYTAASATVVTEGSGFTQIVERQQGSGSQEFIHLARQIVSATTALNYQPSLSVTAYGASIISTFKGY